ncbi:hypothetical protein KKG61_09555 [bacterium]|nr:hypothetical protein [bacterium]
MNGNALRLIKTVAIHLDGDRIVDGWDCYWDASGSSGWNVQIPKHFV